VDVIILAAGRGERISNYAGPFLKPLIHLASGKPLIRHTIDQLRDYDKMTNIVVVASPHNVESLNEAIGDRPVTFAIQRRPHGPGDALRVGLEIRGTTSHVLVLLADNLFTSHDIARLQSSYVHTGHNVRIGYSELPRDEAARFTWQHPEKRTWHEKEPIPDEITDVDCWVGGFVGLRDRIRYVIGFALPNDRGEVLIGPYLDDLTRSPDDERARMIPLDAVDIGTDASYRKYLEETKISG